MDLSFERLLSTADGELQTQHDQKLRGDLKMHKQLQVASRKIQHLTELLRESEASSLRLGDQAKLLKEEIRRYVVDILELEYKKYFLSRLERNQEREKGVSNMEYLKNVVLKV